MTLKQVISGGQTGADIGGLEAAHAEGVPTGGTAPKGYLTEDGPNYRLRDVFGLKESKSSGYSHRTRQNVKDSDGTVLFGDMNSPGSRQTIKECDLMLRPYKINPSPVALADWIEEKGIAVLNVAGNRASKAPNIFRLSMATVRDAIRILKQRDAKKAKV